MSTKETESQPWGFNKKNAEKFARGAQRKPDKKPLSNAYTALKDLFKDRKEPRSKDPS